MCIYSANMYTLGQIVNRKVTVYILERRLRHIYAVCAANGYRKLQAEVCSLGCCHKAQTKRKVVMLECHILLYIHSLKYEKSVALTGSASRLKNVKSKCEELP